MAKNRRKKYIPKKVNKPFQAAKSEEEKSLKDFAELMPIDKREKFLVTLQSFQVTHQSGPIPDAESIQKYDATIPNGADRIMKMAEKQQDHRIAAEKKIITEDLKLNRRGQSMAFAISLICLILGTYVTISGYPKIGAVFIGTTTLGLAGTFIKRIKKQEKS